MSKDQVHQARSPPIGVTGERLETPSLEANLYPSDFHLFGRSTWEAGISESMPKFSKPPWRGFTTLNLISLMLVSKYLCTDGTNALTLVPYHIVYLFEFVTEDFLSEGLLPYFLICPLMMLLITIFVG
ncbi:hypothetical protein AVEN_31372-1 [Araneus ventricosus]|uniref:Uncharacterized protein n=1 Tax=Araneus ventricosus TaxID=182803 RepID=A0A4Y2G251_ARAVE|nr:hypothetical protein AVEN_31372-1 [Araneus ventricosus]